MQTRNLGLRGLTLALAGVLTLGLAACEDDPVQQVPPTTLDVTPASLTLNIGEQAALAASVTNAPSGASVSFASGNTAVATVDASGVVRAVAAGNTTVTASVASNQGGTISKAVSVTVNAGPTPEQPTVAVASVTKNDGSTIDASNVQGQINVRVNYERAGTSKVQVLVDNTVACEQAFAEADGETAAAVLDFVCPIQTDRADPATGTPTFPNGQKTISARLLDASGNVAATASYPAVTFNNDNKISLDVSASSTGVDAGGLQWNGGDVTVAGKPAIFTGETVTSVKISAFVDADEDGVIDAGELAKDTTITAAPFTAVFKKAQLGTNVATDDLRFSATTVVAGSAGPSAAATTAIRYDNTAPTLTAGTLDSWLGSNFKFGDTNASATDVGVGKVTVTFHVVPNTSTNTAKTDAELAAEFAAVTDVSSIAESTTSSAYFVVAVATDAVGNVTRTRMTSELFGVDKTAPTVAFASTSAASNSTNPTAELVFTVTDALSGPSTTAPIESQGVLHRAVGTACLNTDGTIDAADEDDCAFDADADGTVTIDNSVQGYVVVTARGQDAAGNESSTVTRTVLVDNAAPTATISSVTTSGSEIGITGTVRDNVELKSYDLRVNFSGTAILPFAEGTAVGTYGLPLDTVRTGVSATVTPLQRLYPNAGTGPLGAAVNASQVGFGAFDVANNFAFTGSSYTASGTATPFSNVESFQTTFSDATITTAETTTLQAVATDNTDFANFEKPFSTVYFYRVTAGVDAVAGTGDDVYHLVGSTTTSTVATTTSARSYTYSLDIAGSTFGAGTHTFVAVGVQGNEAAAAQRADLTVSTPAS